MKLVPVVFDCILYMIKKLIDKYLIEELQLVQ